jgi:hypothetical protein
MMGRRSGKEATSWEHPMDAVYEAKTTAEWIALLRSGDIVERCAAALALAELEPNAPVVKDALVAALNDAEPPVQAAAQAALGLVLHLNAENRQIMFAGLTGNDGDMQRFVLQSLWDLPSPDVMKTVPIFGEAPQSSEESIAHGRPASPPTSKQTPAPSASASVEMPDIALIHVVPWWFLLGATAVCLLLAWLLRWVWWSKWTMAATAALAGFFFLYLWSRRRNGSLSAERFRARARVACSLIVAAATGFALGFFFPLGTVIIDNESGANVRLFVDGEEWLTIGTGESKRKTLSKGRYLLTVQALEGNRVLDEHDIEVSACESHVLNVLGAQTYFQGKVKYNSEKGSEMKIVTSKWFLLSDMDYMFQEPPQRSHCGLPSNDRRKPSSPRGDRRISSKRRIKRIISCAARKHKTRKDR